MKTVLITGGAGFIGSHFLHLLWNKYADYKILVLDLLTYAGNTNNFPEAARGMNNERFQFWFGDVCNVELVDTLVSQASIVIHFAAESHVTRSIYDSYTFFHTDVMGTHAVANAVLKYRDRIERFIHISTSEVYGTAETAMMSEEHPLKPLSPYASAKCGADRLVWSYYTTYDVPVVIIRPFNNYGGRQHLEKAIPRFITSLLLNEPITIHGDGTAARDYIYVEDNCSAIDMVLHAPLEKVKGKVFNVSSEVHRTTLSIAQDVVRLMNGRPDCISFVADRPGQVFRHTGDSRLIRETLGWKMDISWEEGLLRAIAWYQDNPKSWENQMWMRRIPITVADGSKELH
ncbi:MAG: dTDP-glucose 4,6-dehydratase [Candidatus Methylacidiphilales bacterium]|nr:GDP-mannose 4,6-dehydratase [Candidatus Methylacidiphilales bacterium]